MTKSDNTTLTPSEWKTPIVFPDGECTRPPKSRSKNSKDFIKTKLLNKLDVAGKRVLDLGCSEGIYSFYLAQNGAHVTAADIDRERITRAEYAKQKLGIERITFQHISSVDDIDFSERFDLIVAYGFLHRVSDPINHILSLASRTESIAFEWRSPALLPGRRLGLGLHNPHGYMEWKNISHHQTLSWSKADKYNYNLAGLADFWRMPPSTVISLLGRLNFTSFRVETVRKEYSFLSFMGAAARLALASAGSSTDPKPWPYSRRVHLVASRKDASQPFIESLDTIFTPASWDGRFESPTPSRC